MRMLGPCGTFPPDRRTRCAACSRPIRCVYLVHDEGWDFLMGRRCFERMQAFLGAAR